MIYGYIRVSTEKQTLENQRFEILRFCKINKFPVDEWITEKISGTQEIEKRELGGLLDKLTKGIF